MAGKGLTIIITLCYHDDYPDIFLKYIYFFGAVNVTIFYEKVQNENQKVRKVIQLLKFPEWSAKEINDLIDDFEKHPCLWDVSNDDYHVKTQRQKALKEIEDEIGISAEEIILKTR